MKRKRERERERERTVILPPKHGEVILPPTHGTDKKERKRKRKERERERENSNPTTNTWRSNPTSNTCGEIILPPTTTISYNITFQPKIFPNTVIISIVYVYFYFCIY